MKRFYLAAVAAVVLGFAGLVFAQKAQPQMFGHNHIGMSMMIGNGNMGQFMNDMFTSFDHSQHVTDPAQRKAAAEEHGRLLEEMRSSCGSRMNFTASTEPGEGAR